MALRKRGVLDVFNFSKFGQAKKVGPWKENQLGSRLGGEEENKKMMDVLWITILTTLGSNPLWTTR